MDKSEILALRRAVLEKEFSRMNERQRQAVFSVNGPLLILAGAGSGKTTVLINRIANILRYGNAYNSTFIQDALCAEDLAACRAYLDDDAPLPEETRRHLSVSACLPWKIMAITFTNKAAGELKDRLCAMLGEEEEPKNGRPDGGAKRAPPSDKKIPAGAGRTACRRQAGKGDFLRLSQAMVSRMVSYRSRGR